MGKAGVPLYGVDLGSTVEKAEKILAVIKTNKFDKEDVLALRNELEDVLDELDKYYNENQD